MVDVFAAAFTFRPPEEPETVPWNLSQGVQRFNLEATHIEASAQVYEGSAMAQGPAAACGDQQPARRGSRPRRR